MDPAAIRWESVGIIAGMLVLAVWALREPEARRATAAPPQPGQTLLRVRVAIKNRPARTLAVAPGAHMGRAANCEVVVDDPTVSKRHAALEFDGHASIVDLASTNGTYVNGRRIDKPAALRPGDRIALGTAKIVFLGLASRGSNVPKG